MGTDIKIGKQDHFTRYKVYSNNVDINDKISLSNHYIGILHAKDITSYNDLRTRFGNFQHNVVRATIESTDKIVIKNNYYLFCIAEQSWYIVDEVTENSHNESQQFSSRPIVTKTYTIRRGQ